MKTVFKILIFAIFFSSCTKEELPQISSGIIGKWAWVKSSGGIAGVTLTPETEGKQITIEFSSSTVKRYINGNLESEMTYRIESGTSIYKTGNTDLIIYENEMKQLSLRMWDDNQIKNKI